ncbi:NAD-dependent epimerase/dehydratase family protein [Pseudomonas cavernae]|uniref:NAD-dependent epimerase/dehydratase family protein n=1 Tax=Pseudomonas cavernae TaxID=2320867 RepID=UPI0013C4A087|nr:NAD(P)-dependent oxidoreductase [Pseudomonas cavernae]
MNNLRAKVEVLVKVFVFGAAGFIGRALISKLIGDGHEVSLLTRNPARAKSLLGPAVKIHVGDMVDRTYPDLSNYDVVINCAGEIRNESLMRRLHVDSIQYALSSLSTENKTHWIQLSSVGVYGPQGAGVIRESHPFNPVGEYEITKAEGDLLVSDICRARGIPYTIIRPSNVFGDGMSNQSLAQLIQVIRRKLFFFIGRPSLCMMNYVHVDDVVDAIISCMGNPIASGNDFIVSDVIDQYSFVQLVKSEVGGGWTPIMPILIVKAIIFFAKLIPGFPLSEGRINALMTRAVYSTEKIEGCLGFSPGVGIEIGLRQYCRHLMDATGKKSG